MVSHSSVSMGPGLTRLTLTGAISKQRFFVSPYRPVEYMVCIAIPRPMGLSAVAPLVSVMEQAGELLAIYLGACLAMRNGAIMRTLAVFRIRSRSARGCIQSSESNSKVPAVKMIWSNGWTCSNVDTNWSSTSGAPRSIVKPRTRSFASG